MKIAYGLLLIPVFACADTVNKLSWTAPTTRVDGSKLEAAEIKEYEIRYGSYPTELKYQSVVKTKNTSVSVTVTKPGKYCYQARTIADVSSDWSNEVCKTIAVPKPTSIKLKVE